MLFEREYQAIRHYNEAGRMDAEITYALTQDPKVIVANHTFVSEDLRGQGVAGQLLNELIALAEEEGWRIKAQCSYVVAKFEDSRYDFINADK